MKYFSRGSFLLGLFILISIMFVTLHAEESAESCLTCHGKVYDKALYDRYIHPPFLNKQCLTCHVDGYTSSQPLRHQSPTQKPPQIKWLEKHFEPTTSHYFLIPKEKVDDTLYIQSSGKNNDLNTISITLPPLQDLPQLSNDQRPPEISDIRFHGLKRGILYSATISWKTSEPANGQIHYGVGSFDLKTRLDDQYKVEHSITLSPLDPEKTYDYSVISMDIHGNRVISLPLSFSTRIIDQATAATLSPPTSNTTATEIEQQLFAVGQQYFVQISASQPTYMKIGSNRTLRPAITMPTSSTAVLPEKHIPMSDSTSTNIDACLDCHKEYQDQSSHPINVRPKQGMRFPEDLPLLKDGRMHCMTCHAQHSSSNEARIRRATKQELCLGCHKDYG